jgi:transcriptional regulator NrdR family protein
MEDGGNAVRKLEEACHEAFRLYPNSCSHAVLHVIKHYNPKQPFMEANQLVRDLAKNPDWREVSVQDIGTLANQGDLIIGGLEQVNAPSTDTTSTLKHDHRPSSNTSNTGLSDYKSLSCNLLS